jgi:hypothetical protein
VQAKLSKYRISGSVSPDPALCGNRSAAKKKRKGGKQSRLEISRDFNVAFGTYQFSLSNDRPSREPEIQPASSRESVNIRREPRTSNFEHSSAGGEHAGGWTMGAAFTAAPGRGNLNRLSRNWG